jgi:mono/diheme cytochrome c family protein
MKALATLLLMLAAAMPAWAQPAGGGAAGSSGRDLYMKNCAQCHGDEGDGLGHAATRLLPRPRDFTAGKYKIRTTPSGGLPTDDDLRKIIREGMPFTSMPAWPSFTDAEVNGLIAHLKSFSPKFQDPESVVAPIPIAQAPLWSEASAEKGREVYFNMGCNACHGDAGRGEGTSAPTLTDDWGNSIRAADMSKRWTFRGGATRRDIYRTFTTGVNGTPMPSYADSLTDEQRWQLVDFVYSLSASDAPNYAALAVVKTVEGDLDLEQGEALFEGAARARIPLIGQIIQPGRDFHPSANDVEVSAVYNDLEIAIMVQWNDIRADRKGSNDPTMEVPRFEAATEGATPAPAEGGGGDEFWGDAADAAPAAAPAAGGDDFWGDAAATPVAAAAAGDDFWGMDEPAAAAGGQPVGFSDAVAIQFPKAAPTGIRKPYFLFGDADEAVDLWFVDLAQEDPRQYVGRGSASLTPMEGVEIRSAAAYDAGRWTVIFKRSLESRSGIAFEEEKFVPTAFSVWDGGNDERGSKRAASAWFYLFPEPREKRSPIARAAKVGIAILLLEILVVGVMRRRHRNRTARPAMG